MLSAMLFHRCSASDSAVLLFLHGIGEGFHNAKTNSIGLKNLFQQGIPKVLFDNPNSALGPDHPLISNVTVLAPQLPDRESSWNQAENVDQIRSAIRALSGNRQVPIYIVGFSKGGRAAFQLAKPLGCKAIVTIDASPLSENPELVAQEISHGSIPLWMIFTTYPNDHALHRIPRMHNATAIDNYEVKDFPQAVPPRGGARCKSLLPLDNVAAEQRHGTICTMVTAARAPYDWLLRH
jgi:pimeloyl-ACP methyl ester carboxylesterase